MPWSKLPGAAALAHFLSDSLYFTCVRKTQAHAYWAPVNHWNSNPNRSRQPILVRLNKAPGGNSIEVTLVIANIPMVRMTPDEFLKITSNMLDVMYVQGTSLIDRIDDQRHFMLEMLKKDNVIVGTIVDSISSV